VLLGELDLGTLASLPRRLNPTLLINQRVFDRRLKRVLCEPNRRHFYVFRGRTRLDVYGARAFSCDGALMDAHGLRISVSPARDPLPILTDADEEAIARNFQPRLLRYRMANYERVCGKTIDCREFVPEMRDEIRSWLAPICDSGDLTNTVFQELLHQSRELEGARFSDLKCLIVETVLLLCHKPETQHFFVGELADRINVLLKLRHEDRTVSAKEVGSTLRDIGLHAERVAKGYEMTLTDSVRDRIHRLGIDYRVLTIDKRVRRCRFCGGGSATSKQIL